VLGDTLTEKFTVDEIEIALAYEFGHYVHKDVTLGIIVRSVLTFFGFWLANIVMNWSVAFFGYTGHPDPVTLLLLIVALSIFGLATMPLGSIWSRWREVKADGYALQTTQQPQAFISAMTRLANPNPTSYRSTAQPGILNKKRPSATRWPPCDGICGGWMNIATQRISPRCC
jgi:STE24 endopeptidase